MAPNQNQSHVDLQFFIHTVGKPIGETVREYINIRYDRWLDSARYKCDKAGMKGRECEVMSEVIYSLLKQDENFLLKLYNQKKVQKSKPLTALDFYVLRAIDINVNSPTSPYRYSNRPIPANSNVKFERLKVIDEPYDEVDKPEILLKQYRLILYVFKGLDLTEFERAVFEFKFVCDEPFLEWPGPESCKKLYSTYSEVRGAIHHVLYHFGLTGLAPKREATNRQAELAEAFRRTHKIKKTKQSINI